MYGELLANGLTSAAADRLRWVRASTDGFQNGPSSQKGALVPLAQRIVIAAKTGTSPRSTEMSEKEDDA
jgi:hypothetical protein